LLFLLAGFLDEEITELKRRRKELKAEVRLAAAAAKNLKRRRNKVLKVRQPEFVLRGQHVQHPGQAARNFYPMTTSCSSCRAKAAQSQV